MKIAAVVKTSKINW